MLTLQIQMRNLNIYNRKTIKSFKYFEEQNDKEIDRTDSAHPIR